jgi:hypothetical protein
MAATVHIKRWTGAGPTKTDIESANTVANAVDSHQAAAAGSSNPIKIPTGVGVNYSYWVTTRLSASVAPTGSINNIRWYPDAANNFGTGIGCKVAKADSYVQATGTIGSTGAQLVTAIHGGLTGSPVDAWSYSSGTPISVSGTLTGPATGDFGQFIIYQLSVANTGNPATSASAGTTAQETFTWLYDET